MSKERLSRLALDFYDIILEAVIEPEQQVEQLRRADKQLTKIRLYIRLSYDLHCISLGQLEHASRSLEELPRRRESTPTHKLDTRLRGYDT